MSKRTITRAPRAYNGGVDIPLNASIRPNTDHDLGRALGAAPPNTTRQLHCRNLLIAQLLLRAWLNPEGRVRFSRDKDRWRGLRRYRGEILGYGPLMWSVASLVEAGLAHEHRASAGSSSRRQSTLQASETLLLASPLKTIADLRVHHPEVVRLRNENRRLADYDDTPASRDLRHDITEQNEATRAAHVDLAAPDWHRDSHGIYWRSREYSIPARNDLYAIFNSDFSRGGRLYGNSVQRLAAADRKNITMDGCSTVELDYPGLHPRLLAALAGEQTFDADPYDISGFDRPLVKTAFNTLLNAPTMTSATRAVAEELRCQGRPDAYSRASALIDAICVRHRTFEPYFGSGIGLVLQRIDATICRAVLRTLRRAGVVALPVHDSFVVQSTAADVTKAAMERALDEAKADIQENGIEC